MRIQGALASTWGPLPTPVSYAGDDDDGSEFWCNELTPNFLAPTRIHSLNWKIDYKWIHEPRYDISLHFNYTTDHNVQL